MFVITRTSTSVIYGCETCSLMFGEEHKLKVFVNKILRQIFELRSNENGEWIKLHNEKFNNLYCSSNIIREI